MRLLTIGVSLLVAATVALAVGPGPIGSEFEVDPAEQAFRSRVFAEAGGGYVVLWNETPYGLTAGRLRRYDAMGTPTAPASALSPPASFEDAGRDAAGNFVVAETNFDSSSYGVFAQRFDAAGNALAPQFQVNTTISGRQDPTGIGVLTSGGFMVVWESPAQVGVFGQVFDSTPSPVGSELLVTPGIHTDGSRVIADGAGNFVVAWDDRAAGDFDVFARRYDSTGTALGPEFQVNAYTTGDQAAPEMAAVSGGGFIIVWAGVGPVTGVFGKRYDATGTAVGGEFTVSSLQGGNPSVAVGSSGEFVVTWLSGSGPDTTSAVRARSFDSAALPLGADFQVNTYTQGFSHNPHAVLHPNGEFTVVWDTDGIGIRGQRCDATGPLPGDVPIDGQRLVIRDRPDPSRRRLTFGSRDPSSVNGLTPVVRPDVQGMYLHVYNTATGDSACLPLPASGWDPYATLDDPFFYKDPTFANGPCNKAKIVRGQRFSATCRGAAIPYTLDEPSQGSVTVAVILGNARYCTVFGGVVTKDGDGVFKGRHSPRPATCPVPPVPCP